LASAQAEKASTARPVSCEMSSLGGIGFVIVDSPSL
jgi:hypothetical protein